MHEDFYLANFKMIFNSRYPSVFLVVLKFFKSVAPYVVLAFYVCNIILNRYWGSLNITFLLIFSLGSLMTVFSYRNCGCIMWLWCFSCTYHLLHTKYVHGGFRQFHQGHRVAITFGYVIIFCKPLWGELFSHVLMG